MADRRKALAITLDQYATVMAGIDDGVPLAEILAHVGIPRAVWARAREGWEERVVDDLGDGGALADELEAAMIRALLSWERSIAPLDTDLRAYLDFERSLAAALDHDVFLRALGLSAADPLRLQGIWAPRLREPETQGNALTILNEAARELPPIATTPPKLPKRS